MARVRRVDGSQVTPLTGGWQCASFPPGRVEHPAALEDAVESTRIAAWLNRAIDVAHAQWVSARVPGTAAGALAAAGAWSLNDAPRDFDSEDWWFRCHFRAPAAPPGSRIVLRCGGLATLADVWLDSEPILQSDNMFHEHQVDLSGLLRGDHELAIRFASLSEALKQRRPRPRWRAQIVTQQQMRWFRTSLLGRIPEWTPPVAAVGPYREVSLEVQSQLLVLSADVKARLEGGDGVCEVRLRVVPLRGPIDAASVMIGVDSAALGCEPESDGAFVVQGVARIPGVSPWWPFTHGQPVLYPVRVRVRMGGADCEIDLGRTGFRSIEVDCAGDGFGLRVNGVDIFCRGACWSPVDVTTLQNDDNRLETVLEQVRSAGMNMLRVSGTMLYPGQSFHDACDERGILVWQDLMFASMDYPSNDEAFARSICTETEQLLDRLQLSPSLAVLCGNSEVQQQVVMFGLDPRETSNRFFDEVVPTMGRALRPDVPYVPSTPTGGALPFRVDAGVSHYFGVGAYRRPIEDARRSRVRFSAECLGFGNVPSDLTIDEFMDGEVPTNHARWKARVPRDKGAPWDFDDVRDHYVRELFHVDPAALRMTDVTRYLELSRVATGEIMAAAMAEWRRSGSECRGALVWLLRDFWPGAGWGLIDARGRPKAAYYLLRRALQPIVVLATDEGLNGLSFHAVNDSARAIDAELRLSLYRLGDVAVAEAATAVSVPARGATEIHADAVLGRFADTTYSYRFGAPGHDPTVARLVDRATGEHLATAFFFPSGRSAERFSDLGLEASAEPLGAGEWKVHIRTKKFAQAVAFDVRGFLPDDDFFHLEPGGERTIVLRGPSTIQSARLMPLNATAPTKIVLSPRS
jgi:beta-mannosidase